MLLSRYRRVKRCRELSDGEPTVLPGRMKDSASIQLAGAVNYGVSSEHVWINGTFNACPRARRLDEVGAV